jgi:hypothetical protein
MRLLATALLLASCSTISEVPLGADLAGGLDWDAWVIGLEEDGAALCDSEVEGPGLSRPNKVPATELFAKAPFKLL